MKAQVNVSIAFVTDVRDDPESYEGAATPEARMAKEREYLEEAGDYLFQALSCLPHDIRVQIEPLADEDAKG